jgi:hypothetical protein
MSGTKIPPGGLRPRNRLSTQKQTAINQRAIVNLRIQALDCLRNGRIAELRGILANFVENRKIDNLARNFDKMILEDLNPIHSLPKFLDLLMEVMGRDFHRLFAEFSEETQGKIVEQLNIRDQKCGGTAKLLYRLLLWGGRRAPDKRNYQAAAQLLSSGTIYHLLNNYEINLDQEKQLSIVHFVKYRGVEEIEPIISRALMDYSKCGPQATPKEVMALGTYRRIMQSFRDLSIRECL